MNCMLKANKKSPKTETYQKTYLGTATYQKLSEIGFRNRNHISKA